MIHKRAIVLADMQSIVEVFAKLINKETSAVSWRWLSVLAAFLIILIIIFTGVASGQIRQDYKALSGVINEQAPQDYKPLSGVTNGQAPQDYKPFAGMVNTQAPPDLKGKRNQPSQSYQTYNTIGKPPGLQGLIGINRPDLKTSNPKNAGAKAKNKLKSGNSLANSLGSLSGQYGLINPNGMLNQEGMLNPKSSGFHIGIFSYDDPKNRPDRPANIYGKSFLDGYLLKSLEGESRDQRKGRKPGKKEARRERRKKARKQAMEKVSGESPKADKEKNNLSAGQKNALNVSE